MPQVEQLSLHLSTFPSNPTAKGMPFQGVHNSSSRLSHRAAAGESVAFFSRKSSSRSPVAPSGSSTRYAMFPADGVKGFARRACTSLPQRRPGPGDAAFHISSRGDVKQPLIGSCLLDHCGCLPFHPQCFKKSRERRRKLVSDWMSFVMSKMGLFIDPTFLGARICHLPCSGVPSAPWLLHGMFPTWGGRELFQC